MISEQGLPFSYNMLLNQLQSEDGDTKNLLSNSFVQLQANCVIADIHMYTIVTVVLSLQKLISFERSEKPYGQSLSEA